MAAPHPKSARLRLDRDFHLVRTRGRVVSGAQATVRVVATEGRPRLGVAAPRAYGNAVRRNRFRRLVREAFRALAPTLPPCDLLVAPRRGLVEPTLAGLREDLAAAAARVARRTEPA
jgi:ribonuclease P protein component